MWSKSQRIYHKGVRKYFNEGEKATCQNLWDVVKIVIEDTLLALNIYVRRETYSQWPNLPPQKI